MDFFDRWPPCLSDKIRVHHTESHAHTMAASPSESQLKLRLEPVCVAFCLTRHTYLTRSDVQGHAIQHNDRTVMVATAYRCVSKPLSPTDRFGPYQLKNTVYK